MVKSGTLFRRLFRTPQCGLPLQYRASSHLRSCFSSPILAMMPHSCSCSLTVIALVVVLLALSSEANWVDTCAYFDDFDVATALNSQLGTNISDSYDKLDQCVCISGIDGASGVLSCPLEYLAGQPFKLLPATTILPPLLRVSLVHLE